MHFLPDIEFELFGEQRKVAPGDGTDPRELRDRSGLFPLDPFGELGAVGDDPVAVRPELSAADG